MTFETRTFRFACRIRPFPSRVEIFREFQTVFYTAKTLLQMFPASVTYIAGAPAETVGDSGRVDYAIHFHAPERNGAGRTLAVPVNNYFQLVCLGNAAGKIEWAVRHETGQPHPAR